MRTTRDPRPEPLPTDPARSSSWIPVNPANCVGLDPAHWSMRGKQVALWQVMDAWYRVRRTH